MKMKKKRRDFVRKRYLTCVDCHEKYSDVDLTVPSRDAEASNHVDLARPAKMSAVCPLLYECPYCGGILQVGYEEDKNPGADLDKKSGKVSGMGLDKKSGKVPGMDSDKKSGKNAAPTVFSDFCDMNLAGMWRYKAFLPVEDKKNIVTLGEGMTALVRAERIYRDLGIENLYVKNEFSNPTASFKDRPTSVGISVAKECGADTVAVASTGNAGVSVAAYAAKAGMKSIVCAPKDTAKGKIAQLLAYGASIFYVDGNYSDCFGLVKEACQEYGYVNLTSTYINPYTVEADKTIAYELYEQLNGKVPDWIIVPIGTGPLLSGVLRGYQDLKALGLVEKVPRMVGVQAENCSPIAKAFYTNQRVCSEAETEHTIAGGIADQLVGYEKDGEFTIRQIRESGGDCITLSEEELFECWHALCYLEGIFAEPAGAAAVGAVKKLCANPAFHKDDRIVSLVTAHGLKYPDLPNRLENKAVVITKAKELRK